MGSCHNVMTVQWIVVWFFYPVTLEINCSFFFFIHGMVQLSETFGQLCLQGVNGHVSPGENGSKTSETTNQSGSLMSDSLTVTWPKESWNRDHISYCCCNVEVPEHWDLEGGSNGSEFGNQEGYLFPVLCPLPFARQQINQEHKMSVYFPFSPTLCLAFEDSGGLQSCLKQCLFPAPFPLAWLSLWPFTEGREECVSPWRVLNHHVGRVPAPQALGKLDPVTVIQALTTAERVCCQWLS